VESIENELSFCGIFPDEDEPDLHVAYHARSGGVSRWRADTGATWESSERSRSIRHVAGTLAGSVDARENRIVWRAIATATVSGNPKKACGRILPWFGRFRRFSAERPDLP
jgi:hypothetical protein